MTRVTTAALGALLAGLCGAPALAEAAEEAGAAAVRPREGVQIYPPDFFAAYAPRTALDMVNRVPGFAIDGGDTDLRGFGGAAGNVLVDGARPSVKDLSLQDVLARIPAAAVARVELLDAAAAGGADAAGQPHLVNVVRRAGAQASGAWEAGAQLHANGYVQPELEASWTRRFGATTLTLAAGLERDDYNNLVGREDVRDARGVVLEGGRNDDLRRADEGEVNASLETRLGATTARVNARAAGYDRRRVWSHAARAGGAGPVIRVDDGEDRERTRGWEVGADLERAVGAATLKLVALMNEETQDDSFRAGFNAVGAPPAYTRSDQAQTARETIARLTAARAFGAHAAEVGLEVAVNRLDADSRLLRGDGRVFALVPQALSATRVEEVRAEASLVDAWTVGPKLSVEAAFTGEWSTITQTGDGANERSFFYPKPRLALTWRPAAGWIGRASVERVVGQLDFFDFVSAAEVGDGNQRTGNPDLKPSRTWGYEVGVERRWGARGVVEMTLSYEDVQDVVGLVPIGPQAEGVGNIASGVRYGVDLEATVPLARLGVPGGEFGLDWRWRQSELTDPLTLRAREFSGWNGFNLDANFRQDLPAQKLAWGLWHWRGDGRQEFRRDQIFTWPANEGWGAWVETTAVDGLTIELGVENPEGQVFRRERTIFAQDRRGPFERQQYRERSADGRVYLSVKGAI